MIICAEQIAATSPLIDATTATKTRNVLHVINGEHFSGAERVQDLLAGALPDCGYRVGFACVKPGTFAEKRANKSPICMNFP